MLDQVRLGVGHSKSWLTQYFSYLPPSRLSRILTRNLGTKVAIISTLAPYNKVTMVPLRHNPGPLYACILTCVCSLERKRNCTSVRKREGSQREMEGDRGKSEREKEREGSQKEREKSERERKREGSV